MVRVRAGRKFGGWVALFALALQLALAFGHSHPEDFAAALHGHGAAAVAPSGNGPGDDGDHHGAGRDGCTICATIHLARTLLTPTAPAIALPPSRVIARIDAGGQRAVPPAPALSFQARGPPQA